MKITGELVGFKSIKSQKGNDCFFGTVLYLDQKDENLVGQKSIQINAFGSDAVTMAKVVNDKKLLNCDVSVNGYFKKDDFANFYAVTLEKA